MIKLRLGQSSQFLESWIFCIIIIVFSLIFKTANIKAEKKTMINGMQVLINTIQVDEWHRKKKKPNIFKSKVLYLIATV